MSDLVWLEGNDLFALVESDNKAVKNILLTEEVEIRPQISREAYRGREPDMANFDRKFMKIDRDETAISHHGVGKPTFGIVYSQSRCESGQKDRSACATVHIDFSLQRTGRPFNLNLDKRIKLFFVEFIREVNALLHRIWVNSSGPGTGINRGIALGYRFRAFLTASSPVKISPWLITIFWRGNFLTNISRFLLTNESLSKGCFFIFNSPYAMAIDMMEIYHNFKYKSMRFCKRWITA